MEKKKPMSKTEWHSIRRQKGLCLYCNTVVDEKPLCKTCQDKKNLWRKNQKQIWIDSSVCIECGNERFGNKMLCKTHFFKGVSRKGLCTSAFWQKLMQMLIDQNWMCALTGDLLTPENMELDHIISKHTGGLNTMDNVRWVTRDANRAKQHLTDEKLLSLCQKIVNHLTKL